MSIETSTHTFADRHAAGRELGDRLRALARERPVIVGLLRGGLPVAFEVARALGAPLDALVVCKIGAPGNPELGIGAIAEGGGYVVNRAVVRDLRISREELAEAAARARSEVDARVRRYRQGRGPVDVDGRTVVVVDDGLATGATARAALRAIRAGRPRKLVLAVPVGSRQATEALRAEADEVICLVQPEALVAVGLWYEQFDQTSDAEIVKLLAGDPGKAPAGSTLVREVDVPVAAGLTLGADLVVPQPARGLILFAHGSGSSRHSPRNRQVARALNERSLATLLLDLLAPGEEHERRLVFDIPLLAERLIIATAWARREPLLASLPIGYFGASTGGGAALWAAAELDQQIAAVVSRGGRPDLAAERLADVTVPVLLIVGGKDELVLELNRDAQRRLPGSAVLQVVAGATHLFEEPGALEEVSRLAGEWFERHLVSGGNGPERG